MNSYVKVAMAITITLISLLYLNCGKSGDFAGNQRHKYGLILNAYTALRIDPMVFSGIIAQLKKGASVEVLERSQQKTYVGKKTDYWYKVKTKDRLSGWVFGKNIKLLSSEDEDTVKKYVSNFMESETAILKKELAGKWWSMNEFGDFTDHCLELYETGTYHSYMKEYEKGIVGKYKFDFEKNEMVFPKGTSFKSNLEIVKRGQDYFLKKEMGDYELRFKKIAIELPPEPEIEKKDSPKRKVYPKAHDIPEKKELLKEQTTPNKKATTDERPSQ